MITDRSRVAPGLVSGLVSGVVSGVAVLLAVAQLACTTTAPVGAPATPAATGISMADSTHWVRNSAEYRAATLQTYRLATDVLTTAAMGRAPGTWAVILDADETILDNSSYQKQIGELGERFERDTWHAWVLRNEAGVVPGARGFLEHITALGGHIAIVTNRTVAQCPATEEVLRAHDLPYDVILCRGDDSEKEPRFDSVIAGTASPELPPLEVVMWLGDNIRDFPDLDQDIRFQSGDPQDADAFALFGERYILIPNPMYGSWETNPRQ